MGSNDAISCLLNGGVCLAEAFFHCQSHNKPSFSRSSLSAPRKRLLLVTWRSKYEAFLSAIASPGSKYCRELSPRQIKREETASVCCLIAASCLRKHSEMSWTASEKDRICLLHQIETLSGYQPGYACQPWHTDQTLHEREIHKFCSHKAGKDLQMQPYRSAPQWVLAPSC